MCLDDSCLLRCTTLSVWFDGLKALGDVSLALPSSQIVALIGPNGAGKTTLINVLSGFLSPDSGRCFLRDVDITDLPPHARTYLGLVRSFQEVRLVGQISVMDNVMLARPLQAGEQFLAALLSRRVAREERENREQAMRLLRLVNLERMQREHAGNLSYGQQKLLALACCLATDARVLLLDEPISGIHPELVENVLSIFAELKRRGHLIVFVEHDLGAVRIGADLVVAMDRGRVIQIGSPSEVLQSSSVAEAYFG